MAKMTRVIASAVILGTAAIGAHSAFGAQSVASTNFKLFPNASFVNCVRKNASTTPTATATVTRGAQNDTLTLKLNGFKPNLGFDLFTVQRSNQTASGAPVSPFTNFGMAWYQSDVETNSSGSATVTVKTILLDQIFGFDPDVTLAPTNTFHVGFWFDSPAEAQPCSPTPVAATPFNGEHNAGPVAFITRPKAATGLGPLCTAPVKTGSTFSCQP
jgi:hypothetical protein